MVQSNYNLLINPTISTQQGMNENSQMQDLFLEDELDGIFDDDAAPEDFNVDDDDDGRLDLHDNSEQSHEQGDNNGESSDDQNNIDATDKGQSGSGNSRPPQGSRRKSSTSDKGGRRRRSNNIEGDGKGVTPPSWHSEAADKQHRQAMILEIARLLQARKKATPSQEWLHQLPHKARKLEGRLYRSAPSLEAYLDRSTLKNRLRKLARAIMRQYNDGKRPKSFSSISIARSSFSSAISDAPMSSTSLQQVLQRNSANLKSSMSQSTGILSGFVSNNGRPSVISINSNSNNDAEASDGGQNGARHSIKARSASENMVGRPSSSGPGPRLPSMLQMPLSRSTSESIPNQSNLGSQQRSQSAPIVDGNSPSAGSVNSKNNNPVNNNMEDANDMNAKQGMTELERQKAVNAKLQQQIMENIRRQEDLVRRLQEKEQQQLGSGDASSNNSCQPNMQQGLNGLNTSNSAASMSPSMNAMSLQAGNNSNNNQGPNMNSFMNPGQMAPSNMLMAQASMLNNQMNNQMNQQQQNQNNLGQQQNQNNLGPLGNPGMMNNSNNNLQGQRPGMGPQMSNSNNPFLNFQNLMAAQGLGGQPGGNSQLGSAPQNINGMQQQQQLQMLRGSMPMIGSNSNMMSSMHSMQQQGNGMNSVMPPPNMGGQSGMQSNPFSALGNANQQVGNAGVQNNGAAPLSPGSFNW